MPDALRRVALWSFAVGAVSFLVGFIGPIILAPEANQGPLLGIFITGPLGTLAGLVTGVFREFVGWKKTPLEVLASSGLTRGQLLRAAAGIGGLILIMSGLRSAAEGVDRAAASSLLVGGVLLWYATVGRIPAWFGRPAR